jgi:hypothetical protein
MNHPRGYGGRRHPVFGRVLTGALRLSTLPDAPREVTALMTVKSEQVAE